MGWYRDSLLMKRIKQKWWYEIRCWRTLPSCSQSSFESSHCVAQWQAAMFWAASWRDPHAEELKTALSQPEAVNEGFTCNNSWGMQSCQQALRELGIESCPGWYLDFSLVWSFGLEDSISYTWIPHSQTPWDKKVGCLKLLNSGVILYATIDN